MSSVIQMINELRSLKTLEKEKKSFLGIFKFGKDNNLEKILATSFRDDDIYNNEKAVADIIKNYQANPSVFNQFVDPATYKNYSSLYQSGGFRYADSIIRNQSLSNDIKLNLVSMIEFLRIRDKAEIVSYSDIFKGLPEVYQSKVGAAMIWSAMKHSYLSSALKIVGALIERSEIIKSAIYSEFEAFIKYLFGYFGVSISTDLGKSIHWFEKVTDESIQMFSQVSYAERHTVKLVDTPSFHKISEIEDRFSLYVGTILSKQFLSTYNRNINDQFWYTIKDKVSIQDAWSESQVDTFFSLLDMLDWRFQLDEMVVKQVQSILHSTQNVSLVNKVSDYYDKQRDNQKNKALREAVANYYRRSNQGISWDKKLSSGFEIVAIPYNHNPYKGLHPTQVRPYFTLISNVANVDIIKFHKVNKVQHIRFRINENIYDLNTGDGFTLNFTDAINLLLFREGVPYQFLVIGKSKSFNPRKASAYSNNGVKITLFNQEEYNQLQSNIVPQSIAGWAAATKDIVCFNAHVSELNVAKSNPNYDSIDLKSDPKFITLKEEISNLQPFDLWSDLLIQLMMCPLNSNPGKRWTSKAQKLITDLGQENFIKGALSLHAGMIKGEEWFEDDEKLSGLKGLTWILRYFPGKDGLYIIKNTVEKSYRKVTGGPLNAKLGNVGLESLAYIGSKEAYGTVGMMLAKSKYSVFQRAIRSRMKKFKDLLKEYTPLELEDIVVPHFDIIDNVRTVSIGDYEALINVNKKGVETTWSKNGKITKSAPKEVRDNYPLELKSVRADVKSIKDGLHAQGKRLESTYVNERMWSKPSWEEYILNHNLMSVLASKLIWCINEKHHVSFTIEDGSLVDYKKQIIEIDENDVIRLWHPALADLATVLSWRDYFFENEISQPFKQAFREVYLLTPAEEKTYDHSLRFSGHHLKGNTLYSLGKTRQWTMSYDQAPLFKFPNRDMVAYLNIEGGVLYANCVTKELVFKSAPNKKDVYTAYNLPSLSLKEVPPVLLSEVMRDVDLFVAVSGIAYDPYFNENGDKELMGYWQAVAFGRKSATPISEVRKDLLERLLPKTKLRSHFSFVGNHLVIEGKLNAYKINLGSSNILIQPQDKYLCIVPARIDNKKTKKIWLPFEGGDTTLMTIISKAFLLFDDDKITEEDIKRQL